MTLLLSLDSFPIILIKIRTQKKMKLSSKKKISTCITAAIVSVAGPIHRQARVTFHNFTEVTFREILLIETTVD